MKKEQTKSIRIEAISKYWTLGNGNKEYNKKKKTIRKTTTTTRRLELFLGDHKRLFCNRNRENIPFRLCLLNFINIPIQNRNENKTNRFQLILRDRIMESGMGYAGRYIDAGYFSLFFYLFFSFTFCSVRVIHVVMRSTGYTLAGQKRNRIRTRPIRHWRRHEVVQVKNWLHVSIFML